MKKFIYGAVVLTLIILNILNWSKKEDSSMNTNTGYIKQFGVMDFRVKHSHAALEDEREVMRNIFHLTGDGFLKQGHVKVRKKLTDLQRERMMVKRDLDGYSLAGILVRGKKREGFLTNGDKSFEVSVGDLVDGRFVVKRITEESVYLIDPRTKISKGIKLSGF